jgi:5-methylcytosine-specific restriction protein A
MPIAPPRHRPHTIKGKTHQTDIDRARQSKRLYATNSRTWRAIRFEVLSTEPLCQSCMSRGITTAANEVDHIDGDSHNNAASNLQSLCKPCHSAKTVNENGGFGRQLK